MGTGGKRAAKRNKAVAPYAGPLGKWGAMFTSRGNPLVQLEPAGPLVTASSPEELKERTEAATQPFDPDEKKDA